MLLLAQMLYNKILEKAKAEYERDKNAKINDSTLNRYMKEAIEENKEFLKLYSQTRQDIFMRLKRAFQNFFMRVKEKKEGKKVKRVFRGSSPLTGTGRWPIRRTTAHSA